MDKNNRNILVGLALLLGLYFFMRGRKKTNQLNATMNPSILSGSEVLGHVSHSEFAPYVTTIGLYSDKYELLYYFKF